jgi:SNF2 family DNA or RNA helicase
MILLQADSENFYSTPPSSSHEGCYSKDYRSFATQGSCSIQPSEPLQVRQFDSSLCAVAYARRSSQSSNAPVPAPMPTVPSYTTTKPVAPPSFGSSGNIYGGFQSINSGSNYIDLTRNEYRTSTMPDPFTFVDPAKAQEDLKALLEGVMEDEEDMPRTRSRKKRKDAEVDNLAAKLKGLDVEEEKFDVASDDEEDDGTVEGIKVKLLPHQVEGLEWMTGRELGTGKKGRVPKGGILADDMGLGKTLQSISLILNNPKPTDEALIAKRKLPSGVEKCTLVVAPLALIRQWEVEIKDKVANSHSLRVIVHHGPGRTKRFQDLKKYDVVITTYQILVSEFGSSSNHDNGIKVGCFGLHWYRVILDEAHTIKNRNAKATQACYALRSEYRWCLTGTPMQNNLDELQSLIKFLRIKPYDDLREFKDQIDRPMKNGRGDVAIKRLRHYLKIFMKRRTKEILAKEGALNPGGKPSAPGEESTTGFKVTQRKIEKVFALFSPEERHFYERLEQRTDASIEQMMSGEKVNYASALVLLLRLRQACNHPKLVAGKLAKDSEALASDTSTQKAKALNADIDEVADMFGALGVGSKKCEVCQLELGKQAIADGAIRCLDCEADLEDVSKKHKSRKDKKKKKKKHTAVKSEANHVVRKPRNRAVITDSDDEDEEGSWVVPEEQQGSLKLGKAGGLADENAEGGGEWLDSNDDTFPDLQHIGTIKKPIKVDTSDSGSDDDGDDDEETDSDEDVEDEFQSDSDEEAQLATMVTSTKITHLIQILGKEIAEHKFIVFSQFTSMLDLIEPFLRQKGFKFTRYDGSMRNDHREASLSKLRNDKNCRILLCSLKCGSLGLNLTAATRVVILEPFWNPVSPFT